MTRFLPLWWALSLAAAVTLAVVLAAWWQASPSETAAAVSYPPAPGEAKPQQVEAFCGACHATPPPDIFPRDAWRVQVKQGYDFYRASARRLDVPPLEGVVSFYERQAPEQLPPADLPPEPERPWLHWQSRGERPDGTAAPGVANVSVTTKLHPGVAEVLVCDAQGGQVLAYTPGADRSSWRVLGRVPVPCHAEVVDLDRDGRQDLLVADLGWFLPSNDKVGSVVWLRGQADGTFKPVTLLDGVGRVADVQAADFDGDGKLDLVVAEFGWRIPGSVLLLHNETTDWDHPVFRRQVLDERPGSINVCVGDVDRDGRPDVVALISQEHETVVAFLNAGGGTFCKEVVWTGPHPAFSCSGTQLVDLDGDGDLDVLLSNGDVLDRPTLLKPFHGITWLENAGGFPFKEHRLAAMYGATRAVAADLDGDGDLDVVAVSFLPPEDFPKRGEQGLDAVVLLEQTAPGKFIRRSLAKGNCDHWTCAVGDLDCDGRPDLVTGNFTFARLKPGGDWVEVWKNLGPAARR